GIGARKRRTGPGSQPDRCAFDARGDQRFRRPSRTPPPFTALATPAPQKGAPVLLLTSDGPISSRPRRTVPPHPWNRPLLDVRRISLVACAAPRHPRKLEGRRLGEVLIGEASKKVHPLPTPGQGLDSADIRVSWTRAARADRKSVV